MPDKTEQLPPPWREEKYRLGSFDSRQSPVPEMASIWEQCERPVELSTYAWRPEPGWERSLKEVVDKARIERLEREIGSLTSRIDELKDQLDNKLPQPVVAPIATLAPEPFELIRPVSAVITPCEEGFVASFIDANISSTGETRHEAVENLKDLIVMIFQDFEGEDHESLGPAMSKQKHVLFDVIRRRN